MAASWIDVPAGTRAATAPPTDRAGFSEQMRYEPIADRAALLARADEPWVAELRADLEPFLDRDRAMLSVGSGQCEHEVPLHLAGYDVTASDVLEEALDDARRLVPGFRAVFHDALAPTDGPRYDDVLATGLDYALDDGQLRRLLRRSREMLRPRGRVLLVHRFRDTPATRVLDRILVPAWGRVRDLRHRLRRDGLRTVPWPRGWRRTQEEIVALATAEGFRLQGRRHSLLARELERIPAPAPLLRAVRVLDRRTAWFNSATILELRAP